MYRTADEALYDTIVRRAMPYTAPADVTKLESDEQEKSVEEKIICAECFSKIVPFSASFIMDAGYGETWLVSGESGLCRSCFDRLRANPPKYRPVPRVKINYAFGSEELKTIEDINE